MKKNRVYGIEEVERLYKKGIEICSQATDPSLDSDEKDIIFARAEYYTVKAWNLYCSLNTKSIRGKMLGDEIGWDVHTIPGVGY